MALESKLEMMTEFMQDNESRQKCMDLASCIGLIRLISGTLYQMKLKAQEKWNEAIKVFILVSF